MVQSKLVLPMGLYLIQPRRLADNYTALISRGGFLSLNHAMQANLPLRKGGLKKLKKSHPLKDDDDRFSGGANDVGYIGSSSL